MGLFSSFFGGDEPKVSYTTPYKQLGTRQQQAFMQGVWDPAMAMPWYRPISYGGEEYVLPNLFKSQAIGAGMPMMGNLSGSTTPGSPSPFASMLGVASAVLPFLAPAAPIAYNPIQMPTSPFNPGAGAWGM